MVGMPLPSVVRKRCQEFLPPDDMPYYVFPATALLNARSPFNVLVAVSNGQVTVLACTWRSRYKPASVWARYPRATRLGPVENAPGPAITIDDLYLEIDEEYIPVVHATDAQLTEDDALPPDPLPDL